MEGAVASPAPVTPALASAAPPALPAVTLKSVLFGRHWHRSAAGARVLREMTSCRVVGSAIAQTERGEAAGVLVRDMREESYQLVGEDFIMPLATGPTDDFLCGLRRGHHGGGGRTQGPRALDGRLYTVRYNVTLPMNVIADLSKRGNGVLSLGLRRLAGNMRKRLLSRHPAVPDLRTLDPRATESDVPDGAVELVRVYLDVTSLDTLRALGGGNLSRGIRFAVWAADKRLK